MANTIACNLASYGKFRVGAYAHLRDLGLCNVELPLPPEEDANEVLRELDRYGLVPTTFTMHGGLDDADVLERWDTSLERVAGLGVDRVFTSFEVGELGREEAYRRLREIGVRAEAHGILVCLETHPDLGENGAVARQTMEAVEHPNIRVNFDTANIYYYNQGVSVGQELAKTLDYVEAVHLKDTNGGYKTWHFPALGEGVVDFAEVFARLSARGYEGPYTFELEGIEGEELDEVGIYRRVEDSLEYLRSLGLVD